MQLPENRFKNALVEARQQVGLWCSLGNSYALEVVAGSGFDWLLLDTEHSPNDVLTILPQLQVLAGYSVSPVVRPAWNDPVLIKRYLDIGVQTLLIPYVRSADEAAMAVAATRYPPEGIRGVSALTRASRFGRVENYAARAAGEICVLVQVETQAALEHIDEICAVEGVDGVFVGPGDLAASMGYAGQPGHAKVKEAVENALVRIRTRGKPAGVLTGDRDFARRCMDLGSCFTAIGVDAGVLARQTEQLARWFGEDTDRHRDH